MAFTSNMTATSGRVQHAAYCKVSVYAVNKTDITILVDVWESSEVRSELPSNPLPDYAKQHILPTLDVVANNPIDYAYKLLEASDFYPEATWNI